MQATRVRVITVWTARAIMAGVALGMALMSDNIVDNDVLKGDSVTGQTVLAADSITSPPVEFAEG